MPDVHNASDDSSHLVTAAYLHAMLQDEAKYLVFDGDVDAVWVENMNSVMDDNKLLTLPNGERIRLQPHCRLLFEVDLLMCMLAVFSAEHIQQSTSPLGLK